MTSEATGSTRQSDLLAYGILPAAILLFVGTGTQVANAYVDAFFGHGSLPDQALANALALNIVIILAGWRRHVLLSRQLEATAASEREARHLADHDVLTDCHNRRSFKNRLANLLDAATRNGRDVAVFLIDLDNFKQINDEYGHAAGDTVLQSVSRRLGRTMPDAALIGRLGGDEFVCAATFAPDRPDEIELVAKALLDQLAEPVRFGAGIADLTASCGIAVDAAVERRHDGDVPNPENLLQRADIAMYQAKKQGKRRFCWFAGPMRDERRFRATLESGIRRGLAAGEFVPFFEQQVDLASGKLEGFEMLARWHSPDLGLVAPDVFIPVAEEMGIIGELSEALLEQALTVARDWHPSLTLAVNISPSQLRDPWFAQKLLRQLVAHSFAPARFEVEITESCLLEPQARVVMESLRNQGITVSLDDFGTGYAGLSQLRTLPFDRLKIDRSFVSELRETGADTTFIDAIISLGRGLSIPITAEGVECDAIVSTLAEKGMMKGQGYFYGQPEPADAVRARLASLGLLVERAPATSSRSGTARLGSEAKVAGAAN